MKYGKILSVYLGCSVIWIVDSCIYTAGYIRADSILP